MIYNLVLLENIVPYDSHLGFRVSTLKRFLTSIDWLYFNTSYDFNRFRFMFFHHVALVFSFMIYMQYLQKSIGCVEHVLRH